MGLGALFQVVLALVSGGHEQPPSLPALTPREKAALVVVSGLPAPTGVAGVLVQNWSRDLPRPPRELAVPAAKRAIRAGADLVLLTNGPDAERVVHALVPLARRGELDEHVERVLELRRRLGLRELP
jgi:hypothetical protein